MIRVVLCSHDVKLQPLFAPALGSDFEVLAEPNGAQLQQMLADGTVDVVLLDLGSDSCEIEQQLEVYNAITEPGVAVVVMADDMARPMAIDLVQRGAHSYCRKPPALRELKTVLRRAYEHVTMSRQLERKPVQSTRVNSPEPASCDGLIGASAEMQKVYEKIRRVASLDASVLVTGESGTGKELIARAIHNLGDRAKSPFVAVSCGAIPETLIESELFGHEKGAFTGTTGTRTGYFEQAGGGTLFLDEIGELSLQTQVKLLRVVQQKEFTRLGSGRAIPLRARLILATHRDLPRMVSEGSFRLDLYYRINVMTINAPALADRPEDIPLLANFFLKQYSDLYRKYVASIEPDALLLLQEYDWPGNVRELENVIQSAIICADTDGIRLRDLPERLHSSHGRGTQIAGDVPRGSSFEALLRDFKVKLATKAIEDCNGNKTLAAQSLNISRAYLHRLIRLSEAGGNLDAA
ncbi:MAG: sigma-54-dependent Fis family transcriptional regulator [Acidobacteriaceae bacterium]|nr:sigma-54-dependent Fis family transcriptional regulator [Acidobacteriaceae bacterium]